MSDSVRPHRRQPTRLPRPWDSPGKNTGVGCHLLLQCMKVKSEREVAQSCPTLSDPMDYSLPCSSIHGIFQARVLEWGAIAFSARDRLPGFKPWFCNFLAASLWTTCQSFLCFHFPICKAEILAAPTSQNYHKERVLKNMCMCACVSCLVVSDSL